MTSSYETNKHLQESLLAKQAVEYFRRFNRNEVYGRSLNLRKIYQYASCKWWQDKYGLHVIAHPVETRGWL